MRVSTQTSSFSGKTGAEAATKEHIRCRAYELYEERGREDGHAVEDWLRAEGEIRGGAEKAEA